MCMFCLLVCSAVLGGVMGYRALNSGKFMPSGLIAFIRLIASLFFVADEVCLVSKDIFLLNLAAEN